MYMLTQIRQLGCTVGHLAAWPESEHVGYTANLDESHNESSQAYHMSFYIQLYPDRYDDPLTILCCRLIPCIRSICGYILSPYHRY